MMFANRFYTDMTASASRAEASFPCTDSASNMSIAALLDAVIAASIIIIAMIAVGLICTILAVGLLLANLVLVLVGLLILGEVNRRRRRVTA